MDSGSIPSPYRISEQIDALWPGAPFGQRDARSKCPCYAVWKRVLLTVEELVRVEGERVNREGN